MVTSAVLVSTPLISHLIEVNPCVQIRTKNKVNGKTIKEIWEDAQEFKILRQTRLRDLRDCLGCEYRKYCFFCPGISYMLTGSFTKPYKEACEQARIRKEVYEI